MPRFPLRFVRLELADTQDELASNCVVLWHEINGKVGWDPDAEERVAVSCSVLMTYAYHATAGCRSSDGLAAISSKEACEAASVALGLSDTSAEAGTFNANPDNPPGCFINTGNGGLYFNNGGFTDASSSTRRSLCLRSTGSNVGVIAVDNVRYRSNELHVDDLDACQDACAALPNCTGIQHTGQYVYHSMAGCRSLDSLSTISSKEACDAASIALGLHDTSADEGTYSGSTDNPPGCFFETSLNKLFFNLGGYPDSTSTDKRSICLAAGTSWTRLFLL